MSKTVIFVSRETLLNERQQLLADARKLLEKIISVDCHYHRKIKNSTSKDMILTRTERLIELNVTYLNRLYKISKKLNKIDCKLGE